MYFSEGLTFEHSYALLSSAAFQHTELESFSKFLCYPVAFLLSENQRELKLSPVPSMHTHGL